MDLKNDTLLDNPYDNIDTVNITDANLVIVGES